MQSNTSTPSETRAQVNVTVYLKKSLTPLKDKYLTTRLTRTVLFSKICVDFNYISFVQFKRNCQVCEIESGERKLPL